MSSQLSTYASQNAAQDSAVTDDFSIERYHQFAKHLPSSARHILDVGCAEGRGGQALKVLRPEIELSGLDCVPERLAALPVCYDHAIHGLTNDIPLNDRCCDVILAGEFIEHLYPADVDPTLCEFQRILAIGEACL